MCRKFVILQSVRYTATTYVVKFCFSDWQAVMWLQEQNTCVSTNAEQSVWRSSFIISQRKNWQNT